MSLRLSAWSLVFLALGLLSIGLFHADVFFPLWLSVTLMALVVLYFVRQFREKKAGALMGSLLLVYLLPFIHIPPYIWYDFTGSDPLSGFGGLASNPYMFDQTIITLTAMIGTTGALGMAFGISLNYGFLLKELGLTNDGSLRKIRTMSKPIWLLWTMIGLGFSIISAPRETIFVAEYTQSAAINQSWNFSSAWLISYIILNYAFVDALLDSNFTRRLFKRMVAVVSIAYVVIWLQLLRGDRESMPWLLGLLIVYFYWAPAYSQRKRIINFSWAKVAIGTLGIVVISMVIGSIRHGLTGANMTDVTELVSSLWSDGLIGIDKVLTGTWSAVLLTPLSVAGDYVNGHLTVKWGQDYTDILLSLPPGFISDALGFERPLSESTGPAWEMRYGAGGTHAAVLPFRNLLITGVFLIPAAWSYFFTTAEKKVIKELSVINLSFLVTLVMVAPHWLWYGEKPGINAFIIWAILAICYRVSLSIGINRGLPPAHP